MVNKVGAIDSQFRFFQMEVIAGEPETTVDVFEGGCHFRFDYAKVYWNSRLQFEHQRVVRLIARGATVCDLFCGVGPFALPAARRGCLVYANDLNPESVRWLQFNAQRNRVEGKIKVYNMDARKFVKQALADLQEAVGDGGHFDHFIMNLPASAHEFLDVFPEAIESGLMGNAALQRATIHCYVFCKTGEDPLDKIEGGLGQPIIRDQAQIRRVRDVAPNKEMFCVSFKLPPALPAVKRAKVEREGEEEEEGGIVAEPAQDAQ